MPSAPDDAPPADAPPVDGFAPDAPPARVTEAARGFAEALPEACIAGVEANIRLLAHHWQVLRETGEEASA